MSINIFKGTPDDQHKYNVENGKFEATNRIYEALNNSDLELVTQILSNQTDDVISLEDESSMTGKLYDIIIF